MTATLLIAAHGTVSEAGSGTTQAIAAAVAAARPGLHVELCFLDVATPRLADALDKLSGADVVVVPLLLSAGYHVSTDIPTIASRHQRVSVARHLGPDPLIVAALAERLDEAGGAAPATTLLAAVSSTRASARDEVEAARAALEVRLGRTVQLLPLDAELAGVIAHAPAPVAIASYLLAEGAFLTALDEAVGGRGVVAAPIGVHPLLVQLVLDRFDEDQRAVRAPDGVR